MKTVLQIVFVIIVSMASFADAEAKLQSAAVEYKHGDTALEGFLVYDDAFSGKRPAIIVVHEWWGLNSFVKGRAEQLAKLGYIAFAIDMYGKGVRAKNAEEAGMLAGMFRSNRPLMRARAAAGLEILRKHQLTDSNRLAAMGYCFGGGTVLELARGGAALRGFASLHGNLDTPTPADAGAIKGKVLILHGGDDPYVKTDQILSFQEEMRKAGVDWQMIYYGGAVHSFTNPEAGNDNSRGAAYNERADIRSWEAMKLFFTEIFR